MIDVLALAQSGPGLLLLGLSAFCDTLIGVGFFVFAEPAFIAGGAAWAAHGAIGPAIIVLLCAWLGDLTSFGIGRLCGKRLSLRFLKPLTRRRAWRMAQEALARKGALFIVISRLLGPVAWVTPFLAGTLSMPFARFAPAAALGTVIGVGQFLVLGALGTRLLPYLLPFLRAHFWTALLGAALVGLVIVIWRRSRAGVTSRLLKVLAGAAALFLSSNIAYFFVLDTHSRAAALPPFKAEFCALTDIPMLAYPGATDLHLPQPVNILLIGDGSGADLMEELNWHRNLTFSRDRISILGFVRLLLANTPPVSELTFLDRPANSAFQMPGNLKSREHIRWWDMGAHLSFGAISRDDELAIKYYRHLPVLLHDIDPKVDQSRDMLAAQIAMSERFAVFGFAKLGQALPEGEFADFETDGRVLVVLKKGAELTAKALACLGLRQVPTGGQLTGL